MSPLHPYIVPDQRLRMPLRDPNRPQDVPVQHVETEDLDLVATLDM
jgi:hypothetical protein